MLCRFSYSPVLISLQGTSDEAKAHSEQVLKNAGAA